MATQVEKAIAWAKSKLGSHSYDGYCQKFVMTAYSSGAGMPYAAIGSAKKAYQTWAVQRGSASMKNIPVGASVYFHSPSSPANGHVGLYIGNGQVIHAFRPVKIGTVAGLNASGYTYLGWGWTGGRKPTGAGEVVNLSGADRLYSSSSSSDAVKEEPKVIHIPQVDRIFTVYEDDNERKGVDRYKVVWKPYGGYARDITDVCSDVTLTDDSSAVCTELSFSVLGSVDERYLMPLWIQPGDEISVTNTSSGQTVFVGMVETMGGDYTTSMQIDCLDDGRMLTKNEIILQCNNIAAKAAISAAANAAGIAEFVCPNLISSVYDTFKESAGDIISGILETVTSENGVNYFPRVMGGTLVIRSFAEKPITPWHRQDNNIRSFKCLDEAGNPSLSLSLENMRNQIIVYSEKDSSVSMLATEKAADSIKHYGLRQGLDTYSDDSGVSASAKAKKLLAMQNRVEETLSLTCYGSDAVIAGVRLTLDLAEAQGDFWVVSVTHTLGDSHMMSMELRRCT